MQHLSSRGWPPALLQGKVSKIRTHQHIGFKLHLFWHVTSIGKKSLRCMERVFSMYGDLQEFCDETMDGALEGLCDCVGVHFLQWFEDKVERCCMEPSTQSQTKLSYVPRSWVRTLQETERRRKWFCCGCPVSSSYIVY